MVAIIHMSLIEYSFFVIFRSILPYDCCGQLLHYFSYSVLIFAFICGTVRFIFVINRLGKQIHDMRI